MMIRFYQIFKKWSIDIFTVFLLIALPLSIKFTNISIIGLAVSCLISNRWIDIRASVKENIKGIVICILGFLFTALSISYSVDSSLGAFVLEKQLPLLLLPFILSIVRYNFDKLILLRVFALTIFSMAVICLTYGIYNYYTGNYDLSLVGAYSTSFSYEIYSLFGESIIRPFSIHPIYMSLFVSFSTFIIFLDKLLNSWFKGLIIFFLFLFQALIGSRIGLIGFFGASFIFLFLDFWNKKTRIALFGFASFFMIVTAAVILLNPVLKRRYVEEIKAFNIPKDPLAWNSVNMRLAIWKCSFETFTERPVLGYGAGAQGLARNVCLKTYSFYGAYGADLNSHNQYFEYVLMGGFMLLGMFLFQLFYFLRKAIESGTSYYFIFLFIFIITCFGESLLETNKGIVFFAFFNSFFLFKK